VYDRAEPEGSGQYVPAELAHHFLLAICARPGVGICFRDRGWHPKIDDAPESNVEETFNDNQPSRIYNKILANFVCSLTPSDDIRQQELAIQIIGASPELLLR